MEDLKDKKKSDDEKRKANAERQRNYRNRQKYASYKDGSKRLDLFISKDAWLALDSLSTLHGNSKKEILEKLILQEEELVESRQNYKKL